MQDTGKYVFGVEETLRGLEMGAVETLICWENLDVTRYVLANHAAGEEKVRKYLSIIYKLNYTNADSLPAT